MTRDGDVLGARPGRGGSATRRRCSRCRPRSTRPGTCWTRPRHRLERARFALQPAVEEQSVARPRRRPRSPGCTSPTPGWPPSPSSSASSVPARAARGEAERLAASIAGAEEALDADARRWPSSRSDWPREPRAPTTGDAEPDTTRRDRARGPAASAGPPSWRPGSRCAPARSGPAPWPAAPTRSPAPPSRSARHGPRRAQRWSAGPGEAAVAQRSHCRRRPPSPLERSLRAGRRRPQTAEQARAERDAELAALRGRLRELAAELERLTDSVHRDEVARAEQRLRIEALEQRAVEELGVDPDILLAEYGPDLLVPPSPPAPGRGARGRARPDARTSAPSRRSGCAAPSGRWPCSARSTRWRWRSSPRWRSATVPHRAAGGPQEDPARPARHHPRGRRARPGGLRRGVRGHRARVRGRVLAAVPRRRGPAGPHRPDDMLTTGIEVEARPPGKKVKRLSLLSGGERSLVAVALLVAIFRPGPARSTSWTRSRPRWTTPTSAG